MKWNKIKKEGTFYTKIKSETARLYGFSWLNARADEMI